MKGDQKMSFERAPGLEYEMDNLAARVYDVGGSAPMTIISTTLAWQVQVEWEAVGVAVSWYNAKYSVDAFLESIGPGGELQLGPVKGAITAGVANYKAVINVPPGAVVVPPGQDSIPMKLVTTITVKDNAGNPVPMAAFIEGPILQFY
jgi:hypothetical protein